jgi:hypothetical protein
MAGASNHRAAAGPGGGRANKYAREDAGVFK